MTIEQILARLQTAADSLAETGRPGEYLDGELAGLGLVMDVIRIWAAGKPA